MPVTGLHSQVQAHQNFNFVHAHQNFNFSAQVHAHQNFNFVQGCFTGTQLSAATWTQPSFWTTGTSIKISTHSES